MFQKIDLTEELTKSNIKELKIITTREIAKWMKPMVQYFVGWNLASEQAASLED